MLVHLPYVRCVAQVSVQDHPGQLKPANDNNRGGFTPVVHVRTAKAPCMISKIHWKMSKRTGGEKIKDDFRREQVNDFTRLPGNYRIFPFLPVLKRCAKS